MGVSTKNVGRSLGVLGIFYYDLDYGTWVYTYIKIHQDIYLNCAHFTSYKLSPKNKIKKHIKSKLDYPSRTPVIIIPRAVI